MAQQIFSQLKCDKLASSFHGHFNEAEWAQSRSKHPCSEYLVFETSDRSKHRRLYETHSLSIGAFPDRADELARAIGPPRCPPLHAADFGRAAPKSWSCEGIWAPKMAIPFRRPVTIPKRGQTRPPQNMRSSNV